MNYVHKSLAGAIALGLAAAATPAAAFPDKPIEFVIPFGAGGGADIERSVPAAVPTSRAAC
jgi:tripartite-type tricarboxylate transporter receptor subunit TctC